MKAENWKAEILCVGTELLLGDIVNTNAGELSAALRGLGIGVYWQSVVGDNPARLRQAVEIGFQPVGRAKLFLAEITAAGTTIF